MPALTKALDLLKAWSAQILATFGLVGLTATAAYGAKILDAVEEINTIKEQVARQDAEIRDGKLNAFFTCVMLKQVISEQKRKEIELTIEIPLSCVKP